MLFNSYEFIFVFLPATLLVFFALGRRGGTRMALAFLVVASLVYYGWWNPLYLVLILFSILFNFWFGKVIGRAEAPRHRRKVALWTGIAINLAMLGYFKYADFTLITLNRLFEADQPLLYIVLPLGISFFTFQQIAYLVDAYEGETQEYDFLNYCLFVSFFPQLIAGPIVHHKDVMPQFAEPSTFHFRIENLAIGGTIFAIGLFKKVIFADTMAGYASPLFGAAAAGKIFSFWEAWIGSLAYSLQLYFDFSGYSDMAIGAARIFGILIPLNFNSPYKSLNIIDFWRRWHMTLSRFLRDYLYIPMGGNRVSPTRRNINLMLTMLLGGLWHGAGWQFVLWGGLHGFFLIVNRLWHDFRTWLGQDPRKEGSLLSRVVSMGLTFLAVVVAWVFFRANSVETAFAILGKMFSVYPLTLPPGLESKLGFLPGVRFDEVRLALPYNLNTALLQIAALLTIAFLAPNTQEIMARFKPALDAKPFVEARTRLEEWVYRIFLWRPTPRWAVLTGAITLIAILYLSRESEFIYYQF
ncbi:MAG: MBOAT family protein [Sumerlaeia bacterium]